MTVQQGRSERRGIALMPYGELLSEARTPLADFSHILLEGTTASQREAPCCKCPQCQVISCPIRSPHKRMYRRSI